jgi:hypothetical protein
MKTVWGEISVSTREKTTYTEENKRTRKKSWRR